MPRIKRLYIGQKLRGRFISFLLFSVLLIFTTGTKSLAQDCPYNIDFETGTFENWTCYTGYTTAVGNDNQITLNPSGPVNGRHTMYSKNSGGLDPYGNFPVNCPNGSGYSIRLGNNFGGGEAEGISYEFTIPANENSYSLIYHYAVVFQAPNHRPNEQPRMEIEITNVTDNTTISCASFTFIAIGSSLPGFQVANNSDTTTVLYKNWSAVSVDLSGNAGKRIRLFFKTADCTFRRHFGYSYIDVDSECSGSFLGATYCPDDTAVNVTAPFGYQGYTWYDSAMTRILGSQQTLTLKPPPPAGTTLAVKLDPYNGYGCPKTLFATLKDTLKIKANAGRDTMSCNLSPVPIGAVPKPGQVYRWSPTIGLSDPTAADPTASPGTTTSYVVTTTSAAGGCRTTDTVVVRASVIDKTLTLTGKPAYCISNEDSAVLSVQPGNSVQWYRNDFAITNARQNTYKVTLSGTYHAVLINESGCISTTDKQTITVDKPLPGITYPVEYAVQNSPLVLNARSIGETALWTPAVFLDKANVFTPTFVGNAAQQYTIRITTSSGCVTVDTQLVKTIKSVEILVPSAFTPNKDGKNDYLRPILLGVREVRYFRIFNRWGQLLYETKTPQPGWDGSLKGIDQQTQTIIWVVEAVGVDGKTYIKKGTTVLLR